MSTTLIKPEENYVYESTVIHSQDKRMKNPKGHDSKIPIETII